MSAACSRIEAYLDGTLSDAESAVFEGHLVGCAHCQAELESGMQLADLRHRVVFRDGRGAVPQDVAARGVRNACFPHPHPHRVAQVVDV